MKLTDAQKRAIAHTKGNLQLIACAGSGKTEVVARLVANLLNPTTKPKVAPAGIIAFTYTDKAAGELKERIVTRCHEENGNLPGLAELYVGTIHAFCLDLLKTEVPRFLKFEVLNEVQQALFVDRHSKQSGLTTTTDLAGQALRRYIDTNLYVSALSILRESALNDKALRGSSAVKGLRAYRTLLGDKDNLDYSAILDEAVRALRDDAGLRSRMRGRVRYVIVDEYQDVNPIQECIVKLLHDLGAYVCVVGDDDQTIYQWRGSDVGNILTFEKRYPKPKRIRLEENFRSSRGIVETARDFISQNAERLPKAMKPTDAQPFEAGDIVALAFDDPDAEAEHIVSTVKALLGVALKEDDVERGLAWSDMAVLFRLKAEFEPVATALRRARIPYVVTGMNNLFSTPEAEAARQLFYFIRGRTGEAALVAAWRAADLGVSKRAIAKAVAGAKGTQDSLDETEEKRWSFYSLQRQFLTFLEDLELREESVPDGRGEVVLYNLGKFSQLISDFETIHYHSKPAEKYEAFCGFLEHRAESAYPEGWQDSQYANPDAVRLMTIHQAKGMQWPVVFIPALVRNRFPCRKRGGKSVWHVLPKASVVGQVRYEGSIEDERRLFYVAMTRAQKFLHMTWAPVPGNTQAQRVSEFWDDVLKPKSVRRRVPDYSKRKRLPPSPRASVANVALSFSDLKYFFECPYQFKLRILYGFNAPIHEALGYGKSLHDILHEVHSRAIRGDVAGMAEVPRLIDTHLHTPYAYPALRDKLEESARRIVSDYLRDNKELFDKIEFSEKGIEINLGDGITVNGRIDLVRRIDTDETTIVDLKSNDRTQSEEVTEAQLHIYALGYKELTGRNADYVEIYDLDGRKRKPRSVDDDFIEDVKKGVREAADALRHGALDRKPGEKKCASCDYGRMCSAGAKASRGMEP
jgi:DNA helicase-2/ATP-dependent DNA helicase PcrA